MLLGYIQTQLQECVGLCVYEVSSEAINRVWQEYSYGYACETGMDLSI